MRARVERGCQCQLVRRGDLLCRRRVNRHLCNSERVRFFFHVSRSVTVRKRCTVFVTRIAVAVALPLSLPKKTSPPRPSRRSCVFTISPTRNQTAGTIRSDNGTVVRWWIGRQRDSFDFAKLAKRTSRFVSRLPVKRRRAATFHRSSRFLLFLSLSFFPFSLW